MLEQKLSVVGLSLNPNKTQQTDIEKGFDFLGFHFIRYPRRHLWVQPERKRAKRFRMMLKSLINAHKQVKTKFLILGLNRRIRGWTNYYKYCKAHRVFDQMDSLI